MECTACKTGLAANPATPVQALVMLSTDGDLEVRQSVLHNPATPPIVRALLLCSWRSAH